MADMKEVHDFAVKWAEKFRDEEINYIELVDHYMADDCINFEFVMDCGDAFGEVYGSAVYDSDELDKVIDEIADIPLLGSAVYSRWRFFNHWAYTAESILEPKNRLWFILALDRLAVLSDSRESDTINRIALDYHRVTKIKPKEVPEDAAWEFAIWDYTEQLIIDRETETVEHIQTIGSGCKISHRYEIEGGIESLLDRFDANYLFENIVGNPDDVIETPNETKDYVITISYEKKPQRLITGTFDKNGLPDDFKEFADVVFNFIRFYGLGEILDSSVYSKAKRRKTDYIFCSVEFSEGYKSYYYLTEDDSIEVGDFVYVPVGKYNHEVMVEVVNIEYFSEEKTPIPLEKIKRIIGKVEDDDEDEDEDDEDE